MRRFTQFIVLALSLLAAPAAAQEAFHQAEIEEVAKAQVETTTVSGASRFAFRDLAHAERAALAAYGPFRVLDDSTAALVDVTDEYSPAAFGQMLRDHPGLATLAFIECPGTYDDGANLALGRMIREAGLAAWVPDGGSVRSGAVELVLAGASLTIEDGAEFAVHSWLDEAGYEPDDYAADSPANRRYLAYYREMGMSDGQAAAFYAMTNSVPFEDARWLDGVEMRRWVASEPVPEPELAPPLAPRLAYLDLGLSLY